MSLTFDKVTNCGTTSVNKPQGGPRPKSGFWLKRTNTYYTIETTATFTGKVKFFITYGTDKDVYELRQYDSNNLLEDNITTTHDRKNSKICGETDHL